MMAGFRLLSGINRNLMCDVFPCLFTDPCGKSNEVTVIEKWPINPMNRASVSAGLNVLESSFTLS